MLKMKSKKQFDIVLGIVLIPFFVLLLIGKSIPYEDYIIYALVIFMVTLLIQNAELVSGLSNDNPKIKTFKRMNGMLLFVIFGALIAINYINENGLMSKKTVECYVVFSFAILMMAFGNYLPKIPFNRYMGYRLPWTVRDSEVWQKTHRMLGMLAFPIAILQCILIFFYPIGIVMSRSVMMWLLIPGVYSLYLYIKKVRKQQC